MYSQIEYLDDVMDSVPELDLLILYHHEDSRSDSEELVWLTLDVSSARDKSTVELLETCTWALIMWCVVSTVQLAHYRAQMKYGTSFKV